jgi:hypothetical protein
MKTHKVGKNGKKHSVTRPKRQAIVTKYFGPSNSRGSRIKAKAAAGSVTVPYDHGLNADENHDVAAIKLAEKYHWLDNGSELVGGGLADSSGYAYVLVD